MAFWKKIFGAPDAINKGLDMVRDGVDMAFFTAEEKSIHGAKIVQSRIDLLKALGPQSKARRYLTYLIGGVWTHNVLLMTYLYLFGIIAGKENCITAADKLFELTKVLILPTFLIACAFYYAANVVRAQK